VPTFAGTRCLVVSVTNSYDRNLGFLDRSRYILFQEAPQLYSRGWLDPFPDPLLLRKSGSARNRTRGSGSVSEKSDHWPRTGLESHRTHDHILLSHLRLPQPGGPGPRIYIPQEQGSPVIPPGTVFSFRRLLRLAGLRWRYSIPPPHGAFYTKSKLLYDRQSVGPSWCQAPTWDPRPIFPILSLIIFFDSFGFIDVGRSLWREVWSVLFSFGRASPAQPFSDLSPTGLMSIVYCLYFWDSSFLYWEREKDRYNLEFRI
jgi:hypothetical protein